MRLKLKPIPQLTSRFYIKKRLGKCKTCGEGLDLRNDSEASLSCEKCKFIYKLPDNSDFFLSGQTCQTCGSDVFLYKKDVDCRIC